MEEEKVIEAIYPRLNNNVEPSAPAIENEYVEYAEISKIKTNENNNNNNTEINNYRLEHISKIKDYLNEQSDKRYSLSKKYKKADTVLHYTSLSLNSISALSGVAGVSTLPTIFLLPLSLSLSGVSALTAGLSIISSKIQKKLRKKEQKHRDIYTLSQSKLNTIESLISKALNNNHIDHNEFQLILDEQNKYNSYKESIRTKHNKDYDSELKEIGRNEIRESFKKLIHKNDISKNR